MDINNNGDQYSEQKTVLNELIQGKELVKQLRSHLDKSSSNGEVLINKLVSSFDKVISISTNKIPIDITSFVPSESTRSKSGSPPSKSGSPQHDLDSDANINTLKRRKIQARWTERVDVGLTQSNGIEGPLDDGYSWRKYGQKDILGAMYPRSYYRCTYRHTQECSATKYVQRTTNSTIFEVTYRGKHTCIHVPYPVEVSQLPYNKHKNKNQELQQQNLKQQSQEVFVLDFEHGLKIKTEDLQTDSTEEASSSSFSFTPSMPTEIAKTENQSFLPSPQPYFLPSSHGTRNNVGGMFHFNTSESCPTSPFVSNDFGLETGDFDSDFPFDHPDLFN